MEMMWVSLDVSSTNFYIHLHLILDHLLQVCMGRTYFFVIREVAALILLPWMRLHMGLLINMCLLFTLVSKFLMIMFFLIFSLIESIIVLIMYDSKAASCTGLLLSRCLPKKNVGMGSAATRSGLPAKSPYAGLPIPGLASPSFQN